VRARGVIATLCVLAAGAGAASASATSVLVVNGRGWGHGVGMSQWGAEGYAQHGWRWQRILGHYYPGTQLAAAPVTRVRVLLGAGQPSAAVGCPGVLHVSDASGRGHLLHAGVYRVGPGLKLPVGHRRVREQKAHRHQVTAHVVTVRRALRSPLVFDCPSAPLTWNGRAYHGLLVVRRTGHKLSVVDSVALDDYVRGVVGGEMPDRWRIAALAAQAVAARSYAVATLKPGKHFDLFSDTRSQVYGGVGYETPRTNEAVARTAGRVLTWNGHTATTFFFSTSGGRTADVREVWPSAADAPYLRSVSDPYDVRSPHHTWGPVVVRDKRVSSTLHAAIQGVRVERSTSGHASAVLLGGRRIDADTFRAKLGLASTVFTLGSMSLAATQPEVTWGAKLKLVAHTFDVGRAVLQQRAGAGEWKTLRAVRGDARVVVEPQGATLYRLSADGVSGPVVGVAVSPQLHATPIASTVLSGTVQPRSSGAITVERHVGAGWRVVAHPRLDSHGVFHAPLRLKPGAYRVSVAGDARYAAAATQVHVTTRLLASLGG
jgi:stage II sporulation protein D